MSARDTSTLVVWSRSKYRRPGANARTVSSQWLGLVRELGHPLGRQIGKQLELQRERETLDEYLRAQVDIHRSIADGVARITEQQRAATFSAEQVREQALDVSEPDLPASDSEDADDSEADEGTEDNRTRISGSAFHLQWFSSCSV